MQPGELKKLQEKRFIDTFRRAYINIPYYREKCAEVGINKLNFMDEIQTLKDIEKLPFITKQDLRDTYPYGMFAVPNEQIARVHASSGTTGKQVVAGYTQNDLDIWSECCARALVAAGATANDYMHISYGYGLFTGGFGVHGGAEKLGMTIIPVGTGNTKRQITILKDFGSDYICCTPSYALFIA
jgi:phenylacetate-CoA ligase